ncbi:MAG: DMT family transporter [Bryobacteraceae bacterium]
MNWISFVFAIGAGVASPFQTGANAQLDKSLQQPIWTALAVYITGVAGLFVIQAFLREALPSLDHLTKVPWWAWTGGAIGLISTIVGLALAQKLGSGLYTGLSVTASILTSVLLDQFGILGFKTHPASPLRITGCALMITGLWLVAKF